MVTTALYTTVIDQSPLPLLQWLSLTQTVTIINEAGIKWFSEFHTEAVGKAKLCEMFFL